MPGLAPGRVILAAGVDVGLGLAAEGDVGIGIVAAQSPTRCR
jgi:hypothetical protein